MTPFRMRMRHVFGTLPRGYELSGFGMVHVLPDRVAMIREELDGGLPGPCGSMMWTSTSTALALSDTTAANALLSVSVVAVVENR